MDIIRFDRWVKCICRNKMYSYYRSMNRYYQRHTSIELMDEGWHDRYFIRQVTVDGFPVEICDGELYESICKLSDHRKSIVMLYYFAGYTDAETGNILKTPLSTVHYNRMCSLAEMRKELMK